MNLVFCGWKGGYSELLQSEICYRAVPGVHLSFQEVLLINLLDVRMPIIVFLNLYILLCW